MLYLAELSLYLVIYCETSGSAVKQAIFWLDDASLTGLCTKGLLHKRDLQEKIVSLTRVSIAEL